MYAFDPMKQLRHTLRWQDLVWLLVLIIYIFGGTGAVPFHGDESTIIYTSRDYFYQFVQRDLSLVTFNETPISPTEQHLRLLNGTVSRYLFGLVWYTRGGSINTINEQWDWGADWQYNLSNGHIPTDDLLITARTVSSALLAASVVVLFTIGMMLGGRWVAYLASLYYALNPAVLLNGRRAMMEGGLLLFTLLVVLMGLWYIRKRTWRAAIGLGIASGLAVASKHPAAVTVLAVFGGIALDWLWTLYRNRELKLIMPRIAHIIVAGFLAFGVFYVINPAWWGDPVGRLGYVINTRTELLEGQVNTFGGYVDFGDQSAGFLRQTFVVSPQYYEVDTWQEWIAAPIAAYESSIWRGVSLGGSVGGALVIITLMSIGAWSLVMKSSLEWGIKFIIGLWVTGTLLVTLLLTPLEWQRYYLLAYPAVGLLAAVGIRAIWMRRYPNAAHLTEDNTQR